MKIINEDEDGNGEVREVEFKVPAL